jgi:peptidyl-prolyl cis-trans isomerase C
MVRLIALISFSVIASGALAQNIATVNSRPIPKAREDAWVKTLTQQGQQDSPQLREMVKQELIRREVFMQEATRRGLPEKADVKFQLDVQRQNALIQALMRDEMEKRPITDADVQNNNFSIVTVNGVVHVIGKARSRAELDKVLGHARGIPNVRRVVSYVRV